MICRKNPCSVQFHFFVKRFSINKIVDLLNLYDNLQWNFINYITKKCRVSTNNSMNFLQFFVLPEFLVLVI